jgi:glycosyltransferase involved in cell wall biosynthesis
MTSRRRLGFVTTSFPRYTGDFAGNFVYHMAEAFADAGYDIDVIVPEAPPIPNTRIPPAPIADGGQRSDEWLQVHRVRYMFPPTLQKLCFADGTPENLKRSPLLAGLAIPLITRMWQRIEQLSFRWDAVVSHWLLPSALIAPRVPDFRIPHIAIAHSGDVHFLSRLFGKSVLSAAIARRCDVINFVSRQLKAEFMDCLPAHISPTCAMHVTPMGIPPTSCTLNRDTARRQLGFTDFTVLFVGRLSPIKGVTYLIDALLDFNGTLVVAGDGESRPQLEDQCRQKNILARFVGTVPAEQRDLLFRAADVLVLPSVQLSDGRHEGAPAIIAEAMQAGIPVIATRTGGIPERIQHMQNGLLVPGGDAGAIREALEFIQENKEHTHRLTTAAKRQIQHLRWNLLIRTFIDMLSSPREPVPRRH